MSATVTADLVFFSHPKDGSPPFIYASAPSSGEKRNWVGEHHDVEIDNVRGKQGTFTLDSAGFQFGDQEAKHTAFISDEDVKKEYYPESIELVKSITGATRIVPFDHTIRRRRPGEADDSPDKRQPVPQAHVDQTPQSAVARVHRHLPASDVPGLLKKRFQIINLWRPIDHPALDWPLALCDYSSIDPAADLVPVALRYPDSDKDGVTFGVKYSEAQQWKYLRGMQPSEYVLIKCYDSRNDGKTATFTPHTAFADPTTPEGTPYRESIELRLLVFYD
ncbi:predicted protein [Sparassis crispa]|uniref:7alpha-cephem-methoxylase P8 chain related protein n=1 Tax=Sparassis crispa TaxID=139825 RepID=A0A401GR46_9APHY|nr:predicted protein [Sparassis crispa]GBE84194.1 predicted protein [Sparassis crispa]